jgi:23S rRNA pseudouridine955/2504/2580 synthase
MSAVEHMTVAGDEANLRLDRWFRRHFPGVAHGRLQKLLRTGQVRVDGRRAKSDLRLEAGQSVRVPPMGEPAPRPEPKPSPAPPRPHDADLLRSMILYQDDRLLVLNKPPGLAVQGGTGTTRHIDGLLRALEAEDGGRLRLVHRLDRDTSGILLVARTAASAAELTAAFRRHEVEKLYWAIVVGRPDVPAGTIDLSLAKQSGRGGERMEPDDEEGRKARTVYRTIARAGRIATWLALKPLTGRTHQLRVHCAAIGTPVLGDGKYGAQAARLAGAPQGLMLHAREIGLPMPDGRTLRVAAPLPEPMRDALAFLGFERDQSLPGARLETFGQP